MIVKVAKVLFKVTLGGVWWGMLSYSRRLLVVNFCNQSLRLVAGRFVWCQNLKNIAIHKLYGVWLVGSIAPTGLSFSFSYPVGLALLLGFNVFVSGVPRAWLVHPCVVNIAICRYL